MLSHADIYRWLDGSEFMGERLVVQFARGSNRPRDDHGYAPRMAPRPRRTIHRMTITGLPYDTSWQVSNFPLILVLALMYHAATACQSTLSRSLVPSLDLREPRPPLLT